MAITPDYLYGLHFDPHLTREAVFAAHQEYGRQFSAVERPRWPRSRPLRVGYVSADFYAHASANFLRPLIAAHDPQRVNVFLYSGVMNPDFVTEQFQRLGTWRAIRGLDDQAVAAQIAEDRIDILVDCAGLTAGKRHGLFAMGPAPVTVTFMGYPDTTGIPGIDYRLSDDVADPVNEGNAFATEQLVRMPNGVHCYEPHADVDNAYAASPPCLANGYVTFGSFNRREKVNDEVLKVWAEILRQVPNSRLVLKGEGWRGNPFGPQGMDRVQVLPRTQTYWHHFAALGQIDIALDSFPYNGTTTTCDALWMGVPVLALMGDRHCARMSASLLSRVGLHEFIAQSIPDYIALAQHHAAQHDNLATIRRTMRERFRTSALGQPRLIASDLETWFEQVALP